MFYKNYIHPKPKHKKANFINFDNPNPIFLIPISLKSLSFFYIPNLKTNLLNLINLDNPNPKYLR